MPTIQTNLSEEIKLPDFHNGNTIDFINNIKNYIRDNHCPSMSMDISNLNIIDASQVTIICSTYHWAKYPKGKISWLISSSELKDIVKPMNLGNIKLIKTQ